MKKSLLLLTAGVMATSMSARHLSADEALSRLGNGPQPVAAISGLSTRGVPSYSQVAQPFTGVYVFNTNPGFIIVSADDCAEPLLGYSTEGSFDYATAPESVVSWLEAYNNEISWGVENGVTYASDVMPLSAAPVVKPIVEALWDQLPPYYNLYCPIYNGSQCPTGCVPTAFGQIMYQFKYPERGQGDRISYQSNKNGVVLNVTCDISDMVFDWDVITRTYNENSSQESREAVSTLLFALGASMKADYSPGATGAYSYYQPMGMYKYMNYTSAIQEVVREFYTTTEWEDILYNQLTQGLPVIYAGYTPSNAGHAFVCDGSDGKGYFHINWGWAGDYNGYFKLNALNPVGQGTGGGEGGYNSTQDMIINIFPAGMTYQNIDEYMIYSLGDFNAQNLTSATQSLPVTLGNNITFFTRGGNGGGPGGGAGGPGGSTSGLRNSGCRNLTGNAGILILPKNGGSPIESYSTSATTLSAGVNYTTATGNFSIPVPSGLSEGSYIVVPIFKVQGDANYIEIKGKPTSNNSMTLEVSESGATLSWGGVNPETTAIEFQSKVIPGYTFNMDFTLENTTPVNYSGTIGVKFYRGETLVAQSSEGLDVSIAAGESLSDSYTGKLTIANNQTLTAGEYNVVLYDINTSRNITNAEGKTFTVTVEEAPSVASAFTISDLTVTQPVGTNPYSVIVNGTVKCTAGYFADYVTVTVTQRYATSNVETANSDYIFLNAGESAEFSVPFQLTNQFIGTSSYQYQYTIKAQSGSRESSLTYTLDPTIYSLEITDSEYTVDEEMAEASVTLNYEVSESFLGRDLQVTVNGEAYESETFTVSGTTGTVNLTLPLEEGENVFAVELSLGNESALETFTIDYNKPVEYSLDITDTKYTVNQQTGIATVTISYEVSESLVGEPVNVTVNGAAYNGDFTASAEGSVVLTLPLEEGKNTFNITVTIGTQNDNTTVSINYETSVTPGPTVSTLDITGSTYTVEGTEATVYVNYEVSEDLVGGMLAVTINGEEDDEYEITAVKGSVVLTLPLEDGFNSFEIVLSVDDLSVKEIVEIQLGSTGVNTLDLRGEGLVEVYDISGRQIGRMAANQVTERLQKGLYIIKQGDSIYKISVK